MDRVLRNPFFPCSVLLGFMILAQGLATAPLLSTLTIVNTVASTIPANGVAQINAGNLPGPCPGGVGLTTALVALRSGWVVVGSLPTSDGTSATIKAGCLIVLNANGDVVETISGGNIAGPWDMTAADGDQTATLLVTNLLTNPNLNNTTPSNSATVVRVVLDVDDPDKPAVVSSAVIGSGFSVRFDPAALIIGPTGVALDGNQDLLFVADSLNNRIAGIPNPLTRTDSANTGVTLSQGGALNDPWRCRALPAATSSSPTALTETWLSSPTMGYRSQPNWWITADRPRDQAPCSGCWCQRTGCFSPMMRPIH